MKRSRTLRRYAKELARNAPGQSAQVHFIALRDAEYAAVAARRLQRVQRRAYLVTLVQAHRAESGEEAAAAGSGGPSLSLPWEVD